MARKTIARSSVAFSTRNAITWTFSFTKSNQKPPLCAFFFCLSTELFVVVVVIINFEFVACGVCDFFSRTFQATNVARVCVCEHPKNKMSKIPKFMRMYMCAWVWVFGYHISFRFSVAIMRSRGSSLDKNQNIVSVEHMCSLLFRVKQKKISSPFRQFNSIK